MLSVVRRYYLYRATLSPGFYVPVSVVYMEARGLGLAEIGFAQGAFLFGMVVSEVPTGYLGDRVGRRNALAFGNCIVTAAMVGFAVADSALDFTLVYVLWSVAWTFRSGTIDAWLYQFLAETGRAEEFSRISGRGSSALRLVSGVAALSAGVLYTVDPRYPFVANAGLAAVGLPLVLSLPRTHDATGDADVLGVRRALHVLRTELARPGIRWLVAYAALFNLVFSVTRVFEQSALQRVGVPVAALGVLYAGFKLLSAVAASLAGPLEDRLGTRTVLFALVPVVGVAYASFSLVPVLLVPALFVRRGVQRVTRPVRNGYVNDRLEDVGRATVLSGVSMALTVVSGTANVVGGRVAEAVGPLAFLSATGVAASLVAGALWVGTNPVRDATPTVHATSDD